MRRFIFMILAVAIMLALVPSAAAQVAPGPPPAISATYNLMGIRDGSLRELASAGPAWSSYVTERIAMLSDYDVPTESAALYIPSHPKGLVLVPRYYANTDSTFYPEYWYLNDVYFASVLVHEAVKHDLFTAGIGYDLCTWRKSGVDKQVDFLRAHPSITAEYLIPYVEQTRTAGGCPAN